MSCDELPGVMAFLSYVTSTIMKDYLASCVALTHFPRFPVTILALKFGKALIIDRHNAEK
jgi:hypothetical protein